MPHTASPVQRLAQAPILELRDDAGVGADEVSACAEGIKAKLFRILGESEPLTSTEVWAKAEVGLRLKHLASCPGLMPLLQAWTGAVRKYRTVRWLYCAPLVSHLCQVS